MYTVVAIEQPAKRRRAVIASAISLALTTALAATLITDRRAVRLGQRMGPADWPVSFQSPADWKEARHGTDSIEFNDLRDAHNLKRLNLDVVSKPPALSAGDVAELVMRRHLAQIRGIRRTPQPEEPFLPLAWPELLEAGRMAPPESAPLGDLPGARVSMPETGDYVHVGLVPPEETRVVILRYYTDLPFTERDVRLCQRIVGSVERAKPP